MKKLELKRINLEEAGITHSDIITKKQQRHILGGYEYGTCVWWDPFYEDGDGGTIIIKECCISEAYARTLAGFGGFWDCDIAGITHWCGTYTC